MSNMISITFHFIHSNRLSILISFIAFPEAVDNTLTLCLPWGPMDPKMKFNLALLRTDSKYDFHVN